MRICMVKPCSGRYPVGGFRVFFEYANRLVEQGHEVHVVHYATFPKLVPLGRSIRAIGQYIRDRLTGGYLPKSWFKLDPRVTTSFFYSPVFAHYPDADVIVASAWQTAEAIAHLPERCGKKTYFIQHLETWSGDESRVLATWELPMTKFVVARWLADIATKMGETAIHLPNAIDHEFFRILQPIEDRPANSILFCSHPLGIKGAADAARAINELREEGLKLDVSTFGRVSPAHWGLKPPFTFDFDPSQETLRDLYNRNAIFVTASHSEGWGLLPAEAAACGAAPIASDTGGHRDFLVDGDSAVMFPPHDIERLKAAIRSLVKDPQTRIALAKRSHASIQAYNWDDATDRFNRALESVIEQD